MLTYLQATAPFGSDTLARHCNVSELHPPGALTKNDGNHSYVHFFEKNVFCSDETL